MRRFYSPEPVTGSRVVLSGAEAHHLLHVDRLRVGQDVILFDGTAGEFLARLVEVRDADAHLEILQHLERNRLPVTELTLLTAVPKGWRMDVLVQMTCELGLRTLVPVITSRSVVRPGANKLEHWRRIILESSKQCGRNLLMDLLAPLPLAEVLDQPRPETTAVLLSTAGNATPITGILDQHPAKVVLLVGPEGGFTEEEERRAESAGFLPVSLGPSTLRVETAAVCATALVLTTLG